MLSEKNFHMRLAALQLIQVRPYQSEIAAAGPVVAALFSASDYSCIWHYGEGTGPWPEGAWGV